MTVSVQEAIDRGLVKPDGDLAAILKEVEKEYAANPPRNPLEAYDLLDRAAKRINPQFSGEIPANPSGIVVGQDNAIMNAGGIRTTLKANGEVLVENKHGDVIQHLLPPAP